MVSTLLPAQPEQRNPVQMEPPGLQLLEVWAERARAAAAATSQPWVFRAGPGKVGTVGGSAGCKAVGWGAHIAHDLQNNTFETETSIDRLNGSDTS